MQGEYWVFNQESTGKKALYVVPTLYTKLSTDNQFNPQDGNVIQIYAQFEGIPRIE